MSTSVENVIYDCAIKLLDVLPISPAQARTMPPNILAREFGTIRVAASRRAGHTEAAVRLARERFAGRAIAFLPHAAMADRFARQVGDAFKLVAHAGTSMEAVRGLDIDAVIVDSVSMFSLYRLERIYDPVVLECFGGRDPRYILLG